MSVLGHLKRRFKDRQALQTASPPVVGESELGRRLAIGGGALLLLLAAMGAILVVSAKPLALASLSRRIGRPVHVDGELLLQPTLSRFTIRFTHLHVDALPWAGTAPLVAVDRGAVTLPWGALLGGLRFQDVTLDGLRLVLRRDARGKVSWSDGAARAPRSLPRIERLALRDASLDYQDLGRALSFQGVLSATSGAGGPAKLAVQGEGRSEGAPWRLQAHTTTDLAGAVGYVLGGHLFLDSKAGQSSATFDGRLSPAVTPRFKGGLEASGPDLHDLSHLINVPLPHTPPYHLRTRLDRTGEGTRLQALAGQVGQSDVSGGLTVTLSSGLRRVDGVLHSRSIRLSDLASVASGGQLGPAHRKPGQFLPTAPINAIPLRKLTGAIRFSAASVQAPTTPTIRSLELRATFDQGRVAADPMTLDLAHGRAIVRFVLDVRGPKPRMRLDAALRRADTMDFRKAGESAPPLQATFDGDLHLQGAGPSLSATASHAFGDLRLHALNGDMQQTQAAVLSGHVLRGAVSLLSRKGERTPIRCAVARFKVSDGEARVTNLLMVTALGGVTGKGGFDLASQTVDLTLRPADKTAGDAISVHLTGPISHPKTALAIGDPIGLVRHALVGLLHVGRSAPPRSPTAAARTS